MTATNDTPASRLKWRPSSTEPQMSDSNKNLVLGPRWGLTPRLTGPLTVGRNLTLTWKIHLRRSISPEDLEALRSGYN
jgi:hypothetical protein